MPAAAHPHDIWDGVSATIHHADLYPCRPDWSIPANVLNYDGLFYLLKGSGWVEQDGERLEALPGDLFISRRGQKLAAGHDPKRPITVYSTGFSLSGAGKMDAFRALILPQRLRLPVTVRRELERCWQALVTDVSDRTSAGSLAARGSLLRLVAETLRLCETLPAEHKHGIERRPPGEETRAAQILAYIDAHLKQRMTLAALARVAHLSPVYFTKLFRRHTGQPPMGYVRKRRIDLAKSHLASSDDTIERIAAQVGIPDPFHFSRIFRREVGETPSAYRARFKNPFRS
jgi:AraC family transcriptional regulator, arabinose operon regulatory protein